MECPCVFAYSKGVIMGFLVFFGVLLVVSVVVTAMSVKQVSQGTVMLVERLGRYRRVLKPGISFIIPVIDSIKTDVTLYTYLNDAKQQHSLITAKGGISTKEEILDPGPFDTIASDNTIVHPDMIVYFRIIDPQKAVYGVSNLGESMLKLVETTLRQEIGKNECG